MSWLDRGRDAGCDRAMQEARGLGLAGIEHHPHAYV